MSVSALNPSSAASAAASPFTAARAAVDPFAQALSSALSTNKPGSASPLDPNTPLTGEAAQLRQNANLSLSEFRRTLMQLFSDAGIDSREPIRLEPDGNGGVNVVGSHPDRDKIEKIFTDHPDLAAKLQALSAQFNALQNTSPDFRELDPLFRPAFGVSVVNDDLQVSYQ